MAKKEIRVQYSGLIIFGSQILSVATGLGFILLLTRSMAKPEYGVWSNIFDMTTYFVLFAGLIPFWTTRFVARGKEGAAKTAVLANLVIALASIAVYIPLVPIFVGNLHISGTYVPFYILASVQIVTLHLIYAFESCLRAVRPQAIGFGLLVEEVSKISLAYLLIVVFHQLLLGAMLSIVLSASLQTLYYLKLLWKDVRQRVRWSYVREWLKGSTAILYNALGGQLWNFVFILLIVYGGQEARADYQAAATFTTIIGYSFSLAFALYPKLLAENSLKQVTASLKTVLMFGFPIAALIMSMSQSLLTVLNVSYSEVTPVLIVLSIDTLVILVYNFYTYVLYGVEKLDEEAKIPLRKLVGSRMFKQLSLPYVQAAITLPTAIFVLSSFAKGQPVQAALYVTIINLAAHVAVFALTCLIMRTSVRVSVPWRSLGKYLFASAVAGAAVYILPHPTTLTLAFATLAGGAALYAALLLAIDRDARVLVRLILQEIRIVASPHEESQKAVEQSPPDA